MNSNLIPKFSLSHLCLQFSVFYTIVKFDFPDVDFVFLSHIFDPLYQSLLGHFLFQENTVGIVCSFINNQQPVFSSTCSWMHDEVFVVAA